MRSGPAGCSTGWRTMSTGRSRANGSGERRCRSGSARIPSATSCGQSCEERRAVVGSEPGRNLEAEAGHELPEVGRPRDRDGDVPDGVLEDEVPADDPRDELAERRVGVRVGGARDGDEARELRVAEGAEAAGDGRQQDGDDDAGPGRRLPLASRRRAAERGEDAGADDGADARAPSGRPRSGPSSDRGLRRRLRR